MRITTRRGDKGYTDVVGRRAKKDEPLVEAIGEVDKLIAALAMAEEETGVDFGEVVKELYDILSSLAKEKDIGKEIVERMEKRCEEEIEARGFVRPWGKSSYIHFARAIAREAERRIVSLGMENAMVYFNRLSDYLFIVAYKYAKERGELRWMKE